MEFMYEAVLTRQVSGGKCLVYFSAPATDINIWSGIPQKKRFEAGEESTGFQREENKKRLVDISLFLHDPKNTIQNPLLCAQRQSDDCIIEFTPIDKNYNEADLSQLGYFRITMPDYSSMLLLDIMHRVKAYLEERIPELKNQKPSDSLVVELQQRAIAAGHQIEESQDEIDPHPESDTEEDDKSNSPDDEGNISAALFEESHITDFWEEIAARCIILEKIGASFEGDSFLGFTKDALESYIRPAVVVDGQHRLKGAIVAAEDYINSEEGMQKAEELISAGGDPDEVYKSLLTSASRRLPVSFLMDTDPAEHVFQFVVVNQKATPIGKALLGTIVSTSLSNEEMHTVADRLTQAGIPLEESRATSYMAKHSSSPFAMLVERGLAGDSNNLLPWSVLTSLVNIFKELKGGAPFHEKNDYAAAWKQKFLSNSPIVADYAQHGYDNPFSYWRSFEGPWRDVFIEFWAGIRDKFGNIDDSERPNYWGDPRKSNLFNKISLTILAADFFKYLHGHKIRLTSAEDIPQILNDWLEDVDVKYFDRDWELNKTGVKKDSPGIRHKWSKLWDEYRSNPEQLPKRVNYRQPSVL